MIVSSVRGFFSGCCAKLAKYVPVLPWPPVRDSFSPTALTVQSSPLPLTTRKMSVVGLDALRSQLFPEDLPAGVFSRGLLCKHKNGLEFRLEQGNIYYFNDHRSFRRFLYQERNEIWFWEITDEDTGLTTYEYWDFFDECLRSYGTKQALFAAISKDCGGDFKIYQKNVHITTYVINRSGYFTAAFEEFDSEEQFLQAVKREKERRAFTLKCFAGLAAGAAVGGVVYYVHSQTNHTNITNIVDTGFQLDLYEGPHNVTQAHLPMNIQLHALFLQRPPLPPIVMQEEVPFVGVKSVISDFFGSENNGAIVKAYSLPKGLVVNSRPMHLLSSMPSPGLTSGNINYLIRHQNHVYLSILGIIQVIEVSDLSNLNIVNTLDGVSSWPSGMAIEEGLLYSIGGYFQIRDVRNHLQVNLLSSLPIKNLFGRQSLIVSNKFGYVSGDTFYVIDARESSQPAIASSLPLKGYCLGLVDENHIILSSADDASLRVIDVSNKFNARAIVNFPVPTPILSLVVEGTTCYAIGGNRFYVIDITVLTNMKIISSSAILNAGLVMSKKDDICYVLDNNAVKAINVKDKTKPKVVNSLFTGTFTSSNCIDVDDYVYFTDSSAFRIATRGNTFNFQGTPAGGTRGDRTAILSAQDQQGVVANRSQEISVQPAITPHPISNQLAVIGSEFNFAIPPSTFDHVNKESFKYGYSPALRWLNLDQDTGIFTGKPASADAGSLELMVTATDRAGASATTTLKLNIVFGPTVNKDKPIQNQVAKVNGDFLFAVGRDAIISKDGDPLTFTATDNGLPLPHWLTFDPDTLTFSGKSPTVGTVQVVLTAEAPNGLTAETSFQIISVIPTGPVLVNPMSNQLAQVGEDFKLYVPPNSFIDPFGGPITFTATLRGGEPLPNWLQFRDQIFSGKPGMKDTDSFSPRILEVVLIAKSNTGTSSDAFTINVTGESVASLSLKIVGPTLSVLGIIIACYRKRAFVLNRCRRRKYQRLSETAVEGGTFEHNIKVAQEQVDHIKVVINGKQFGRKGEMLPGFAYNRVRNRIESRQVPELEQFECVTFQVVGAANVILEQFDLVLVERGGVARRTHSINLDDQ